MKNFLYGMVTTLFVISVVSVASHFLPGLRPPIIVDIPISGDQIGPWVREQKYYAFAYTSYALVTLSTIKIWNIRKGSKKQ